MDSVQILAEIREVNVSYLMLAQKLIRADRAQALFRLGLSEEAADLIALLSPAQVLRVAGSNSLLCRMRVDDDLVWQLLTNHDRDEGNATASRLHASIVMASRHHESCDG